MYLKYFKSIITRITTENPNITLFQDILPSVLCSSVASTVQRFISQSMSTFIGKPIYETLAKYSPSVILVEVKGSFTPNVVLSAADGVQVLNREWTKGGLLVMNKLIIEFPTTG